MKLGQKGKDRITGFEGIMTGRAEYISGCSQVLLAPPAKDGAFRQAEWFDEQRVGVIELTPVRLDNSSTPGPDRPAPRR